MKQWSEKGVNGETAGEFQVSQSRMFHEQFVYDAKVTNGWIYDLYIWTTPPIFSQSWISQERVKPSQNVWAAPKSVWTCFGCPPDLVYFHTSAVHSANRSRCAGRLFVLGRQRASVLRVKLSSPHFVIIQHGNPNFFQALKSMEARAPATCDQLSQGRENNWACTCLIVSLRHMEHGRISTHSLVTQNNLKLFPLFRET